MLRQLSDDRVTTIRQALLDHLVKFFRDNQYLAYETLSAPLRGFLDGLKAVNASGKGATQKTRDEMMKQAPAGLKGDELSASVSV